MEEKNIKKELFIGVIGNINFLCNYNIFDTNTIKFLNKEKFLDKNDPRIKEMANNLEPVIRLRDRGVFYSFDKNINIQHTYVNFYLKSIQIKNYDFKFFIFPESFEKDFCPKNLKEMGWEINEIFDLSKQEIVDILLEKTT